MESEIEGEPNAGGDNDSSRLTERLMVSYSVGALVVVLVFDCCGGSISSCVFNLDMCAVGF
jgi:hypothetical protein